MSKLIQLRHRIRAIETIRKITHAMRLIAMSSHSQLKHSHATITEYTKAVTSSFHDLLGLNPSWHNATLYPDQLKSDTIAIIVIGSQKGLCGSFNTHLFKTTSYIIQRYKGHNLELIPIGQKAVDYCTTLSRVTINHSYKNFSIHQASHIAHELTRTLSHTKISYKEVIVASNAFKNFFTQFPKTTKLIPLSQPSTLSNIDASLYHWEQPPYEILNNMVHSYISSQLYELLFESLLAEHAARFVSMDSATRNAEGLLEAATLEYNKLRQAKITKELTELAGSYSNLL